MAEITLHKRAVTELSELVGSGLATCDAVIAECCFHLPHPSQRRRLRSVLTDFRVRALPRDSDERYREAVLDWLEKYSEHQPDWADGCLAVLSGLDEGARIWTYDAEFSSVWRRPNGGVIPLAP